MQNIFSNKYKTSKNNILDSSQQFVDMSIQNLISRKFLEPGASYWLLCYNNHHNLRLSKLNGKYSVAVAQHDSSTVLTARTSVQLTARSFPSCHVLLITAYHYPPSPAVRFLLDSRIICIYL